MFSFLLDIYLEVELLDDVVTLHPTTRRTARLFSTAVAQFFIPTVVCESSSFSTSLPMLVTVWIIA